QPRLRGPRAVHERHRHLTRRGDAVRTTWWIAVALVLAAGCGTGTPDAKKAAEPDPGAVPVAQPWAGPPPAPAQAPTYQGQTAAQWGQRLQSPQAAARQEAGVALRELGAAGFPYLLQGMRSESEEVRQASLQAVDLGDLVKHQAETLPLLVQLLNDRSAGVRQQAAARLAAFGQAARGALPALQRLAD